jgi:hypothetical protein
MTQKDKDFIVFVIVMLFFIILFTFGLFYFRYEDEYFYNLGREDIRNGRIRYKLVEQKNKEIRWKSIDRDYHLEYKRGQIDELIK